MQRFSRSMCRAFSSSSSSSSLSSAASSSSRSTFRLIGGASLACVGAGALYLSQLEPQQQQQSFVSRTASIVLYPFTAAKEKVCGMFDEVVKDFADPISTILLPDAPPDAFGNVPRTLVLDVEGTLMYNKWERGIGWRPMKRPGTDLFLTRMFQAGYEIVAFSSGHQGNVEPSLNRLDSRRVVTHRLYREATTYRDGIHIKDLSKLNRDLKRVVIIDDEADSFKLQPDNGIEVSEFKGDSTDTELVQLIPFLESLVQDDVSDVREVIRSYKGPDVARRFIANRMERNRRVLGAEEGLQSSGATKKSWSQWLGIAR